jgi:reactive chlorine resistance protein C
MLGRDFVRGPGEEVDLRGFSALLGVLEARGCVLLAIKPLSAKLPIVGRPLAVLLLVSTVSFLSTTPGVSESAGCGFPSLLGEFLLKDIPLLGLSFWTLADSTRAANRTHSGS